MIYFVLHKMCLHTSDITQDHIFPHNFFNRPLQELILRCHSLQPGGNGNPKSPIKVVFFLGDGLLFCHVLPTLWKIIIVVITIVEIVMIDFYYSTYNIMCIHIYIFILIMLLYTIYIIYYYITFLARPWGLPGLSMSVWCSWWWWWWIINIMIIFSLKP